MSVELEANAALVFSAMLARRLMKAGVIKSKTIEKAMADAKAALPEAQNHGINAVWDRLTEFILTGPKAS